jgi:hypothetical protein
LPAHGLGDADLAIEKRHEHKRRGLCSITGRRPAPLELIASTTVWQPLLAGKA